MAPSGFRISCATVADISPEVMNAYRDHFPGRDPYDPLEVIEIEGEHLRSVGFRTHPQSAEEFLRGVIADIRMAGEPQPLRLVSNSRD